MPDKDNMWDEYGMIFMLSKLVIIIFITTPNVVLSSPWLFGLRHTFTHFLPSTPSFWDSLTSVNISFTPSVRTWMWQTLFVFPYLKILILPLLLNDSLEWKKPRLPMVSPGTWKLSSHCVLPLIVTAK